jgi:hypothetical protein
MRKLPNKKAGHLHIMEKVLRTWNIKEMSHVLRTFSWDCSWRNRMNRKPTPTVFL